MSILDRVKFSIITINGLDNDQKIILKEIIIKEQHNCQATGFWKTNSIKYNFLLIAHEYLFIFRK